MPIVWPATILAPMAFGYRNVLADLSLFKGLAYAQTHPEDWQYFYDQCNRSTSLDPRFFYAYETGGLLLAWDYHRINEANQILEKGVAHLAGHYQLALWRAFNAFYFQSDFSTAAKYFALAADRSPNPGTAGLMLQMQEKSRTYALLLNPKQAWQSLMELAVASHDTHLKQMLINQWPDFERRSWLTLLNQQVRLFNDNQGHQPQDLGELEKSGVLTVIPKKIWQQQFRYNIEEHQFK